MSGEDILPEAKDVPRPLPGETLRQAREAQGLTLAEVSGALKFSTRQIEALENNEFRLLQGKTFLRGFVRAYARHLKLPSDPLLEMLEEESVSPPEQIVMPANMGETNPVPFHRRHGKKLALTALVLLLAGGLFWFAEFQPSGQHQTQRLQHVDVALPDGLGRVMENPADSAALSATESSISVTASQPAESVATLSFEFSDRSWLEVKDGSGQVLLTGEFPAGQVQTITGKPPYQLWIGKASAVKVSYAGQTVNLQPYTREEVARFTLE